MLVLCSFDTFAGGSGAVGFSPLVLFLGGNFLIIFFPLFFLFFFIFFLPSPNDLRHGANRLP